MFTSLVHNYYMYMVVNKKLQALGIMRALQTWRAAIAYLIAPRGRMSDPSLVSSTQK